MRTYTFKFCHPWICYLALHIIWLPSRQSVFTQDLQSPSSTQAGSLPSFLIIVELSTPCILFFSKTIWLLISKHFTIFYSLYLQKFFPVAFNFINSLRTSLNILWYYSPPSLPPLLYLTSCYFFLKKKKVHQDQFVLLKFSWMCGQLSRDYTLGEIGFSFFQQLTTVISSMALGGISSPAVLSMLRFCLPCSYRGLPHPVPVTVRPCAAALLGPKDTVSLHPLPLALTSSPSFARISEPWKERVWAISSI